jgi:uncharacterized repeat protein (TIGR03803 family)
VNKYGTVFKVSLSDGNRNSYSFSDGFPSGCLVVRGNKLYGTIVSATTGVYEFDPAAGTLTSIASLDGSYPKGGLATDGTFLYGVTQSGGVNAHGTLYRIDGTTHALSTLAVFNGINGSRPMGKPLVVSGVLYGTTNEGGASNSGTIYRFSSLMVCSHCGRRTRIGNSSNQPMRRLV